MSNFYIQRAIPAWGKRTYVNWSTREAKRAVVFIHGFNGSSMGTFGDFNLDFRYRDEYKNTDVYFYSYDSLYTQIENSGLDFQDFLHVLMSDLRKVVIDSKLLVNRAANYEEVILVAHSLGAVVARFALLRAFDHKHAWVNNCKLVLFAPAHKGAREELSGFLNFPGYLKCLGPLLKYVVVTISQLIDQKIVITPLLTRYHELINKDNVRSFTLAKKVIWANKERVVINGLYHKDEPDPVRFNKDHTGVCKPDRNFQQPFDVVQEILNS